MTKLSSRIPALFDRFSARLPGVLQWKRKPVEPEPVGIGFEQVEDEAGSGRVVSRIYFG